MFGVVFGSLAGSAVNIPIAHLHGEPRGSVQQIQIFGVRYRVPVVRPATTTTLAVNLGGAVIPTAVSVVSARQGLDLVAGGGRRCLRHGDRAPARPSGGRRRDPGARDHSPAGRSGNLMLVAPHMAARVAYVSGSLGTLIGANLLTSSTSCRR